MRRMTLWMLSIVLGLLASSARAERESELRVRFQIISIAGEMAAEDLRRGDIWAGSREDWAKVRDAVTLIEHGRFRLGSDTLEIGEKGCFWNGAQLFFGEQPAINFPADRIRWIPAPDTYLGREETVSVRIESKQSFEYFSRRADGLFEQHRIDLPTGLSIKARPHIMGDKVQLKEMSLSVQAVGQREPVAGSGFTIGKPVLSTAMHRLDLKCRLRRPYGVLLRAGGGHGSILICLDVTDIPQAVWQTIRRESPQAIVDSIDWEEDHQQYDLDARMPDGRGLGMKLSADGMLRSTSNQIKETELPEPVRVAIAAQLHGARLKDIYKTKTPEQVYYRFTAKLDKDEREYRVLENGQFLKK